MEKDLRNFENLTLLGDPFHRLGRRLGLVGEGGGTLRVGLVLGLVPWVVLVALAFFQGATQQLFSLASIGAHVRLLLVIPLIFLSESLVVPQWRIFVQQVVRSGVVPEGELTSLGDTVSRVIRLRDSWLAETVCLLVALLIPMLVPWVGLVDTVAARASSQTTTGGALVGWWFVFVCLPLFRFLLLRWFWRLGLWVYFVWRLERLELRLVPTHPDGVGGLGYLETVQAQFVPLILAFSVLQAAVVADGVARGVVILDSLFPSLAWILLLDAILFLGPLFLFTPKLWACRMRGLNDYAILASDYVTAFEKKWLDPATDRPEETLVGTADLQSLADLASSVQIVQGMRWAPASLRLIGTFASAALLPVLPLFLLQYPAGDLVKRLFMGLLGL